MATTPSRRRRSQKVDFAAEKKARPLFIASLALALALTIGLGLSLESGGSARIGISRNALGETGNANARSVMPSKSGVLPGNQAAATRVERSTLTTSINLIGLAVTSATAFAWILAGIFLVIGVSHAITGVPHGAISVLAGIFLAIAAYFLPRLWG